MRDFKVYPKKQFTHFYFVYECFAYTYICVPCALPIRPEDGITSPGTTITDDY